MRLMIATAIALSFAAARPALAVPHICYDTVDGGQFCTDDNVGKVQVFIYNAGWCPPCNQEMSEMPAVSEQFKADEVVFASLSGNGWTHGSKPDQKFLKAWKEKHNIPFVVAGKFKDFGQAFNSPGYIPFTVILNMDGTVAKSGNLEPSEITAAVQAALGGH